MLIGINTSWAEVKRDHMNDPVPIGEKFPLFGHCCNNWAESATSLVNQRNVRTTTPPESLKNFLETARDHNGILFDEVIDSNNARIKLSHVALKLHQDAVMNSLSMVVGNVVHEDVTYKVSIRDNVLSHTVYIMDDMLL